LLFAAARVAQQNSLLAGGLPAMISTESVSYPPEVVTTPENPASPKISAW
jgi:hypothetical protein